MDGIAVCIGFCATPHWRRAGAVAQGLNETPGWIVATGTSKQGAEGGLWSVLRTVWKTGETDGGS
jgi:hypothetical protein